MVYYFSHLEEEVKKIYVSLGFQEPADINMVEIARYFDIWIDYWPGESRNISIRGLRTIFLHEGLTHEQAWTTFAHELRHSLKHVGDQNRIHYLFREYQEMDANRFMYHFCMPSFMLLQINPLPTFKETVFYLANIFKVDYWFAEKRYIDFLNKKKAQLFAYC
ncbi:ImmA/IrrE family metallo-endopeptidase [Terribacillus saccharophilus]|uniref:ImmA/IrrE family metallo-endopeptidase n=1 Tax=Terribacillus saccharophilus TaxID=361277 RepID=UPI003D291E1B